MSDSNTPKPTKKPLRIKDRNSIGPQKKRSRGIDRPVRQSHPLETAAQFLLGTVVVGAPWFFGSVSAVAQLVIFGILSCCVLIWGIRSISTSESHRVSALSIPVLLFLLIGWIQLIPLPGFLSKRVAEKQGEVRSRLGDSLKEIHPEFSDQIRSQNQISVNRASGRYQLAFVSMVATAFLLGVRFFSSRIVVLRLMIALMANGFLLAVFGAFQKAFDKASIYGMPLEFGGVPFASFVNRNNAAGYLLITLACALGVTFLAFSRLKTNYSPYEEKHLGTIKRKQTSTARLKDELRIIFANLDVLRITCLVVCGLVIGAIALTLSRGGSLALSFGLVALVYYLIRHRKLKPLMVIAIFLVPLGIGAVVWTGYQGEVSDRLSTLQEDDLLTQEKRVQLWKDSLKAVPDYPLLGAGLGSYRYVHRDYLTFEDRNWFFHAENSFLEFLISSGAIGLGLLLMVVIRCFWLAMVMPDRHSHPINLAIGSMIFFLVAAQGVSNFFDFGMMIPANAVTFALLIGAIAGVSLAQAVDLRERKKYAVFLMPYWMRIPVILILLAGGVWGCQFLWKHQATERAVQNARTQDVSKYSPQEIEKLIGDLESASASSPSLEAYEFLAVLHGLRFQHQLMEYLGEKFSDQDRPPREELYERSTWRMLNFKLATLSAAVREQELKNLRETEFFQEGMKGITSNALNALELCPFSDRSIVQLAELSLVKGEPIAPYIKAFKSLNVRRSLYFLRMGDVATAHGVSSHALGFWRRAIQIDPSRVDQIVPVSKLFYNWETLCADLVPGDPKTLVAVADRYFSGLEDQRARRLLFQRAEEVLRGSSRNDAETMRLLGRTQMESGDPEKAIQFYLKAIRVEPLKLEWKLELAELYLMTGREEQARELLGEEKSITTSHPVLKRLQQQYGFQL